MQAPSAGSNVIQLGAASRLAHFPVSFFAVVMGLAGSTIAWQRAETVFHLPFVLSPALALLSVLVLIAITSVYLLKAVRHPGEIVKEFRHPVRRNFFPAISIALLLLSIALAADFAVAARWLALAGSALHLSLTLYVMSVWIHHTGVEISHVNPSWFIPVVGNILVPIAGAGFLPLDVAWFFFSIGLVFWLVLLTIVLYRLFFHAPLPERLTPTLFILVAPPAVGFVAYVVLSGSVDGFARVLYSTALFFTLLLASNAMRFLKMRFFLSAWAYAFPLAAMTIASVVMVHRGGGTGHTWIALGLLTVLTLVVVRLAARTVFAMTRGEVCVEE